MNLQGIIGFFNNIGLWISFFVNICLIVPLIYKAYKYFTDKRYLKKVLGYSEDPVQISHSVFTFSIGEKTTNTFITTSSVKAINTVVGMFDKVNQKYDLDDVSDDQENEMNIGGFTTNKKVNMYIAKYFPDFKYCTSHSSAEKYNAWGIDTSVIKYTETKKGFDIPGAEFMSTEQGKADYAFLIKLVKSDFKGVSGKTVHMLFGAVDIGTIKAAEYLAKYYKQIYKLHKDGHYFLAVEVSRIDGSFNFSKGPIDLTDKMFKS